MFLKQKSLHYLEKKLTVLVFNAFYFITFLWGEIHISHTFSLLKIQ